MSPNDCHAITGEARTAMECIDGPGVELTRELLSGMTNLLADYARQSRNVQTPTPRSLIARTRAVLDRAGVDWRAR